MEPHPKPTSFIRTVLGDIAPSELGVCYAHEHIIIDPGSMTEQEPDFLIDSVDHAVQDLAQFKADGGSAMIDCMPTGGRNPAKLAEVSRRTGVHIVCPTGLHLSRYYPEGHWGGTLSEAELAEIFVAEIERGIMEPSGTGAEEGANQPQPLCRAGLIKIASGLNALNGQERRLFRAAALAQRRTGCPILTHTEQGTAALEQIECLLSSGARSGHIILSHTDRKPDLAYHREILQTGVSVEYDSAFRWKTDHDGPNPTLHLVLALAAEFPRQIMLGMDAARRSYKVSYGGSPGMSYLLTTFRQRLLAAGLGPELWNRIMIANPASAFAFGVGSDSSPSLL